MFGILVAILLCIVFLLQISLLHISLLAGSLVALFAIFHKEWIIFLAFFLGLLVDIVSFQHIGLSSLFFVGLFGVMLLYSRKFEVESLPFVVVFSLAAGITSALLFGGNVFFSILFIVSVAMLFFFVLLFLKNIFIKKQLRSLS